MKFCENCGAQLEDGATFCGECGTKVDQTIEQDNSSANTSSPTYATEAPQIAPFTTGVNTKEEAVTSNMGQTPAPKLSELVTPAKRELKTSILLILIAVLNPLTLSIFGLGKFVKLIPLAILLFLIWTRCGWSKGAKIGVTVVLALLWLIF